MELLALLFIVVVVMAVAGVGYMFYQQIFQHPLGKGEEVYGNSEIGDYPLPIINSISESDGGGD